jgi:hypothetical protein
MDCIVLPHYRLLNSLIADWLLAIPRKPQSIWAKHQAAGCSEYRLDHTRGSLKDRLKLDRLKYQSDPGSAQVQNTAPGAGEPVPVANRVHLPPPTAEQIWLEQRRYAIDYRITHLPRLRAENLWRLPSTDYPLRGKMILL